MAVRLREKKRARAGSQNNTQKSPGFNKKKKSGPLTTGERGLRLVLILILYLF
jgi:hypothetical protein